MNERLINTKEASQLLNIERGTLYVWRNKGKIKMTKIDGQYYVTAEDLQPILDERFKTRKTPSWTDLLSGGGVRIGAINTLHKDVLKGFESQ